MKVVVTKVEPVEKENSKVKGYAEILIDDCFAVHGIRIISGDNGLFAAMPSRDRVIGEQVKHIDIVHPINQETRDLIEKPIIEEYQKKLNENA